MNYYLLYVNKKVLKLDKQFLYKSELNFKEGQIVYVPFGNLKTEIMGVISKCINEKDALKLLGENKNVSKVKRIIRGEDFFVSKNNILIAEFIKERYFTTYFEALNLFIPSKFKSKTKNKSSISSKNISKKNLDFNESFKNFKLTYEQNFAFVKINEAIKKNIYKTFLLFGVTGSGKSEVYISAAKEVLNNNKNVFVLVPEIALTKQTIERFSNYFGKDNISVIHSNVKEKIKKEEWESINNNEKRIVIGTRSCLFAPLKNIGLIIIDEEHESSYKSDMSPKYNAVEVAIKMANISKAVVILGSATPSVVSFFRAKRGYYTLLNLKKRYSKIPMPKINIVDLREELLNGNTSIYSNALAQKMNEILKEKKQVLLLLNRRGYAPFIKCLSCSDTLKCPNCGLPLTYHKGVNKLSCHYCGLNFNVPSKCPSCSKDTLKIIGIGTEKLEEVTNSIFKDYKTSRVDLDTTRKDGELEGILEDFKNRKIDILIGTQIVAKGLDFDDVIISGIILADIGLNLPDFRSHERIFSLITQVAGRAGRRDKRGEVYIQTYEPDNKIIKSASLYDYESFYKEEIRFRELMNFPPFSELVLLILKDKNENKLVDYTLKICNELKERVEKDDAKYIFGPLKAPIYKVKDEFRFHIYFKVSNDKRAKYFSLINTLICEYSQNLTLSADINPYSTL